MIDPRELMLHLVAIRDAVEAAILLLGGDENPAACQHKHREELTALGGQAREWVCHDCGDTIEEDLEHG